MIARLCGLLLLAMALAASADAGAPALPLPASADWKALLCGVLMIAYMARRRSRWLAD